MAKGVNFTSIQFSVNTVDANNNNFPATEASVVPSPYTLFQGSSSPATQGEAVFEINGMVLATTLPLPLNGSDLTFLFAIQLPGQGDILDSSCWTVFKLYSKAHWSRLQSVVLSFIFLENKKRKCRNSY